MISVVVPVYKCLECLAELTLRTKSILEKNKLDYEIIFVDDNSPDLSWARLRELCQENPKVKAVKLSRNFGQHVAISAGLSFTKGDWIVVMDCDLQDDPDEIINLYNAANGKFDIVFGKRVERNDGFLKRLSSRIFTTLFNYFSDIQNDYQVSNFGIYSRKVIDNFLTLKEHSVFFPAFIRWMGFKSSDIEVFHKERLQGKTSYNFKRLIKLALDVIISHSNKPLYISISLGVFTSFFSFLLGLYFILFWLIFDVKIPGWVSIISVVLFFSGVILINLGIIGIYIGKIYNEVKNRPLFIIDEVVDNAK